MITLKNYFKDLGALGSGIEATNVDGTGISTPTAFKSATYMALEARTAHSRVFFIGNGGSAAIASHMATDWLKNGSFAALSFNDGAQLTCLTNDLGYENSFAIPLQLHGHENDLLVAISSSGKSENILAAVGAARRKQMNVITLSGFASDNPLRTMGHLNFYVPSPSYGLVEISHLTICHAVLDYVLESTK